MSREITKMAGTIVFMSRSIRSAAPATALDRRSFLALAAAATAAVVTRAQASQTIPRVSAAACPLEFVEPLARDGYKGSGILRRLPGTAQRPAVVLLHTGITTFPRATLEAIARESATANRFLAAGYVVLVPTFRSRDVDPQSRESVEDCLAAVQFARRLPSVDPDSVVVYGCSGGGDLALEVAAADRVAAIVAEEPASMMFAGVLNKESPRIGDRFRPGQDPPIADPVGLYRARYQAATRAKIARIETPILLLQSDPVFDFASQLVIEFNTQVLVPELRTAQKRVQVTSFARQPHCFCFVGGNRVIPGEGEWVPAIQRGAAQPPDGYAAAAIKAFGDIQAFCEPLLKTKAVPIARELVAEVTA
jgi:dienelactone hydrolase